MSITIENPTAEAIFHALQEIPAVEMSRLKVLLLNNSQAETSAEEEEDWHRISQQSAARFEAENE